MAEITQFPVKLYSKAEHKESPHELPQEAFHRAVDKKFCCDSCLGFPRSEHSPLWKRGPYRCELGKVMRFSMPIGHPDFEEWGYYPFKRPCTLFKEKKILEKDRLRG